MGEHGDAIVRGAMRQLSRARLQSFSVQELPAECARVRAGVRIVHATAHMREMCRATDCVQKTDSKF